MSDLKETSFILLNLVLYAGALISFGMFLLFMYKNIAPKLLSGTVNVKYVASIIVGLLLMLAMITYVPYQIAVAVQDGFTRYMPVMMDTAQMVIDGTNAIYTGGQLPVYIETTNSGSEQTTIPPIVQPTQPSVSIPQGSNLHGTGGLGNDAILNDGGDSSPLGGDPNAGGGSPTLNQWNPSDPVPTPYITPQP